MTLFKCNKCGSNEWKMGFSPYCAKCGSSNLDTFVPETDPGMNMNREDQIRELRRIHTLPSLRSPR